MLHNADANVRCFHTFKIYTAIVLRWILLYSFIILQKAIYSQSRPAVINHKTFSVVQRDMAVKKSPISSSSFNTNMRPTHSHSKKPKTNIINL